MVMLKVIGDPERLQAVLRTNRPLGIGQVIFNGSEAQMRQFAAAHPELVEVVGDPEPLPEVIDPRAERDAEQEREAVAAKFKRRGRFNKLFRPDPARTKTKSDF